MKSLEQDQEEMTLTVTGCGAARCGITIHTF